MTNAQLFFDTFTATDSNAHLGDVHFNNAALRNPEFLADAAKTLAAYLESPDAEA